MYRNDSLLYALTCVRIISSKRVHHVTTYLIHGVPTRLSVSRVENRIYMYHAAPFYRSASNQESSPFLCSPLVLLLLHLAPRQLSASFFVFFIRSFVCHLSKRIIFLFFLIIYPLSIQFLITFYLITYLFSTVDLFLSRRSYFRVHFLPSPLVSPSFSRSTPLFASPILLFSSAFDLLSFFCISVVCFLLSFSLVLIPKF